MKAKKNLVAFLICCLCLSLTFCLGVAAEDGAGSGMSTFALVSLIVGGVVLVGVIVLCIVKREKLVKALRDYKGEMKHITWFPWKSVWRCSVLVIVVCLITALLVGLLDIAFFEAQYALTGQGFSFFK
jgi:preprotein translocase SecE subunit